MKSVAQLPFIRGTTANFGQTTVDTSVHAGLEGREFVVEDEYPDQYPLSGVGIGLRTGKYVKLRLVRNKSTIALLPKRLVQMSSSSVGEVTGYAVADNERCFPVDEWLPSTGVPVDDLFYIVTGGPSLVITSTAGDANNVFAAGDAVAALAAAGSTTVTGGRPRPSDFTGATAVLAKAVRNFVGYALSAKTTANTAADLLVDVRWA